MAKAINYMFEKHGRWQAFTAFLDDGRICLTNNAAERALRGVDLGRKSWLFAGSERGGEAIAESRELVPIHTQPPSVFHFANRCPPSPPCRW
ncbi:putative insertion sequence transposase protein, IS66 family [Roseobacter sp. AzwK-3b]|nr:putative insertion sequence transposase protein, IS66 family [Roseobacter sp. AzwK-3b]